MRLRAKTLCCFSALWLCACQASLSMTGLPDFGGASEPEPDPKTTSTKPSAKTDSTSKAKQEPEKPKQVEPVEEKAIARTPAPAPKAKEWTHVVVKDFEGMAPSDIHDFAKVRTVFQTMPRSMLRVTTTPQENGRYRPGGHSLYYVTPREFREGGYTNSKSLEGLSYTWRRCNVGYDVEYAAGGDSDLCFFSFVKIKDEDPLPAGTLGIVWSNGWFLTADGAAYVIYEESLANYDASQTLAAPFHHHHIAHNSIEPLIQLKTVAADIPAELEKTHQKFIKCLYPLDKAFYEARGRLERQNILWHTKEARLEKMDENFVARVDRTCKRHLEPALPPLAKAMHQYMDQRRQVYSIVQDRFLKASAATADASTAPELK